MTVRIDWYSGLGMDFSEVGNLLERWTSLSKSYEERLKSDPSERVLLLIGPTRKWEPEEIDIIREYVRKGNSLVILTRYGRRPERLNELLKSFDISVGNQTIRPRNLRNSRLTASMLPLITH